MEKPLDDDVVIHRVTKRRTRTAPRFSTTQLINTDKRTSRTIDIIHADGVQLALEDMPDHPELPPYVSLVQNFGNSGLYTAYNNPDDLYMFADGMKHAADNLKAELAEWEKKHGKTSNPN